MHKTNSGRLHGKPTEEFITALLKTPEYDKICELKNQLHSKIGFIKILSRLNVLRTKSNNIFGNIRREDYMT